MSIPADAIMHFVVAFVAAMAFYHTVLKDKVLAVLLTIAISIVWELSRPPASWADLLADALGCAVFLIVISKVAGRSSSSRRIRKRRSE